MPASGAVSLKVYNILGQEVKTLVDGMQPAGNYTYRFDGANLSTGVYFYGCRAIVRPGAQNDVAEVTLLSHCRRSELACHCEGPRRRRGPRSNLVNMVSLRAKRSNLIYSDT